VKPDNESKLEPVKLLDRRLLLVDYWQTRVFAFGLSAKLTPKALELLFPHPQRHPLLNFSS
jgi:hypothetical protein